MLGGKVDNFMKFRETLSITFSIAHIQYSHIYLFHHFEKAKAKLSQILTILATFVLALNVALA